MKIHQFPAIVFTFVLSLGVSSANAAPWAGSGTSADPYQIWNASDLNAIGADANYYGSCFKLMADIDLAGDKTYILQAVCFTADGKRITDSIELKL